MHDCVCRAALRVQQASSPLLRHKFESNWIKEGGKGELEVGRDDRITYPTHTSGLWRSVIRKVSFGNALKLASDRLIRCGMNGGFVCMLFVLMEMFTRRQTEKKQNMFSIDVKKKGLKMVLINSSRIEERQTSFSQGTIESDYSPIVTCDDTEIYRFCNYYNYQIILRFW